MGAGLNRVALLRGVNVGGNQMIAMADLRALFVRLGFKDAKTLLNSGNVVFTGDKRSDPALEKLLELETQKRFNVPASYFVRSAKDLRAGDAIEARLGHGSVEARVETVRDE